MAALAADSFDADDTWDVDEGDAEEEFMDGPKVVDISDGDSGGGRRLSIFCVSGRYQ